MIFMLGRPRALHAVFWTDEYVSWTVIRSRSPYITTYYNISCLSHPLVGYPGVIDPEQGIPIFSCNPGHGILLVY